MNARHTVSGLAVLMLVLAAGLPPAAADDSGYTIGSGSGNGGRLAEARQLIGMGSWGSAIWSLKQVIGEQPDNADAHNLLAYSYRNVGRYDTAEQHYARALEIDPDHRGAYAYLGVLYLETGREARAEENLNRLRDLCGRSCPEYQELRSAIEQNGSEA